MCVSENNDLILAPHNGYVMANKIVIIHSSIKIHRVPLLPKNTFWMNSSWARPALSVSSSLLYRRIICHIYYRRATVNTKRTVCQRQKTLFKSLRLGRVTIVVIHFSNILSSVLRRFRPPWWFSWTNHDFL